MRTFLPVFERELRVRANHRATYWTRTGVAAAGLVVCSMQLTFAVPVGSPAQMGRYVFDGLIAVAFVLSCGTCLVTADAISREKRAGTLDLLFLTRLKASDVLLGKLGSASLSSFCALFALLPALAIPLLAGGVAGGEVIRKCLALAATLLFGLSAGLLASTSWQGRMQAVKGALSLVAAGLLLPAVVSALFPGTVGRYFAALSPLRLTVLAADTPYSAAPAFYWISWLMAQGLAGLLLACAAVQLRRLVPKPILAQGPPKRVLAASADPLIRPAPWTPAKGETNPIVWVVGRRRGVSMIIWAMTLCALAYSGLVSLARISQTWLASNSYLPLGWLLGMGGGLVGGAVVAWMSSRFFVEARRTGELELLLTTPLGAKELVAEQWRILRRLFPWPVLVMMTPVLLPWGITAASNNGAAAWGIYHLPGVVLSLINTFAGIVALCWAGMWFGLKQSQAAAIACSVGLAKGVAYVIHFLFAVMFLLVGLPAHHPIVLWLPQIGVLLFYLLLIQSTQTKLAQSLLEPKPLRFDWARWLSQSAEKIATAVRQARGWKA